MIARKRNRPWTDAEDELCRKHHPDYKTLMKVLKGRSYYACNSHCQKLGLTRKRQAWSALDRMKLRKLYPAGSQEELLQAFPGRTYAQIIYIAQYYRIRRKPKPYKPTGFALLDQVRDKCFELKLTMPDLDAMCRTKDYFSKNGWRGWNKVVSYRKLGRAIRVLDAEVQIDWND